MHYTLKDENGNVLDSSANREPLAFIQGIGALIPGLEIQLEGLVKGDKINAEVAPNDAYGEVREDMFHVVPKSGFQGEGDEHEVLFRMDRGGLKPGRAVLPVPGYSPPSSLSISSSEKPK